MKKGSEFKRARASPVGFDVEQRRDRPDALNHQRAAAYTPCGVHHFEQTEVCPAESGGAWVGVGGPERTASS